MICIWASALLPVVCTLTVQYSSRTRTVAGRACCVIFIQSRVDDFDLGGTLPRLPSDIRPVECGPTDGMAFRI